MTASTTVIPHQRHHHVDGVGDPVQLAWREGTLTRAKELEALTEWLSTRPGAHEPVEELVTAISEHLFAARQAARHGKGLRWPPGDGSALERAISNLDAAEADLLHVAPAAYVLGQIPSLLNQVQRHLVPDDARRQEFERIAVAVGVHDHSRPMPAGSSGPDSDTQNKIIEAERDKIVSIARGASSAGLREQLRVRSFRNVLAVTTAIMMLLAIALGVLGWLSPSAVPLCFQPESGGDVIVVCPTGQSGIVRPLAEGVDPAQPEIDAKINQTVRPGDVGVIEVLGLIAAAISAAAALRRIRGSSEPHGLPVVLALLKLPTGAITAVFGLLLMRGEFIPGLSALDTSGQILAWAIIFGYAQQLFTRFVDQQANTVLDSVRSAHITPSPDTT
jgi:hypothetical protein